ncbi:MAG: hypothetical protein LKJ69_06825 [Lactobacillus sp.]|nr:hypothetical protein [Lactobacillus sp.]
MTTPKQYQEISNEAYLADMQRKGKRVKVGKTFNSCGTRYKIIKATEKNKNGMQAIAVAAMKDKSRTRSRSRLPMQVPI